MRKLGYVSADRFSSSSETAYKGKLFRQISYSLPTVKGSNFKKGELQRCRQLSKGLILFRDTTRNLLEQPKSIKFGESIVSFEEDIADSFIVIATESIADVAQHLAEDEGLAFDWQMCLSGVDRRNQSDSNFYVDISPQLNDPPPQTGPEQIVLPKEEETDVVPID